MIFLIIFFATIFLCIASYFLYPCVIWLFGKIYRYEVQKGDTIPFVSVIISAYNEGKNIEKKITNTLELDYPRDKIEILIGSDGSEDETSNIVKKYKKYGIQLLDFKTNRGKTAVQNDLVKLSKGEIIIFTDAASFLLPDTAKNIVRNFNDERVGCIAGNMHFSDSDQNLTTKSQGIYWRYESKLRELESRLGSLIGVDGPLYAVRRDCYVPLKNNAISDLLTPLLVLKQGKKVILENAALVDEEPTMNSKQEISTRRRITLRGLTGILMFANLLNPLKHPVLSFQIFFHKVLRWFVGPLLIINIFMSFLMAKYLIFKIILGFYGGFFFLALIGWFCAHKGFKSIVFTVPYYFSLINFSATMGIIDFLRKKEAVTWKTIRN